LSLRNPSENYPFIQDANLSLNVHIHLRYLNLPTNLYHLVNALYERQMLSNELNTEVFKVCQEISTKFKQRIVELFNHRLKVTLFYTLINEVQLEGTLEKLWLLT
jgi:hypothetical protein